MACTHAVNGSTRKVNVDGIVLIRPHEFVGRSVGLRPGSNFEKLFTHHAVHDRPNQASSG